MNINTINDAIRLIIEEAPLYTAAYNNSNNKVANKKHKKIITAMNFLIKNNSLGELKPLLNHSDLSIAHWAAIYLLKSETQLAEKKLEEIASRDDSLTSLDAEYALIEWRNGDLNLWESDS